jgi:hypothetical protein
LAEGDEPVENSVERFRADSGFPPKSSLANSDRILIEAASPYISMKSCDQMPQIAGYDRKGLQTQGLGGFPHFVMNIT